MADLNSIPTQLLSKTVYFDSKTPVTKLIPALQRYPAVIINKGKEYYGIVDTRSLNRAGNNVSQLGRKQNALFFAVRAPKITGSTTLDDLIYYFYRSRVRALPYYDGRRVTAVLERRTLLKMMLSLKVLHDMKVNEAMSTPVLAIDIGANIAQAKSAMRENKVNRLVVLQNGKFTGIITNHDILQGYAKSTERLPMMKSNIFTQSNVVVRDLMKAEENTEYIDYNRSLSEAVRLLVERGISSLPVIRGGKPVGILTVTDVLESVIAKRGIEQRKIFITGLDQNTVDYEDEIREELRSVIGQTEKMSNVSVDYVTLRLKRVGNKAYEIQVRLSLGGKGLISLNTTKPNFEEGLRDVLAKMRERVVKEKGRMLTMRKINIYRDAE